MKAPWVIAAGMLAGSLFVAGCEVHPQIRYRDGLVDYQTGKLTEAIGNFQEAYKGLPGDPDVNYWLARSYLDVARKNAAAGSTVAAMAYADKAIFHFDSTLQRAPSYIPAIEGKAEAQQLKGAYAKAAETAERTNVLTPTASTLIAKGRAFAAAGDMDKALIAYRQAAVAEPNNPNALEAYGRALLVAGERDRAIEYLQRAYKLQPTTNVLATLHDLGALPELAPSGELKPVPAPKDLPQPTTRP